MKGENRKGTLKVAIIVLSVLLAISLAALAGTLIYNHFNQSQPTSAVVPDNVITPEENSAPSDDAGDSSVGSEAAAPSDSGSAADAAASADSGADAQIIAKALSLHKRNPDDNTPFQVGNMFPGDAENQYYCIRVCHKGDVTLRFHAEVRPGYEKLAEVLKCRIVLPESGQVLYDGLMRDMPASVNHALSTRASTTSEVYYQVTAYLDTGVGNEYQNLDLIADFQWWVEETENLDNPKTGDNTDLLPWIGLAAVSLFVLILLLKKRSKEEQTNEG